ncbi:phospholipid/cholesterol/gamma-HCH transport system substrate-binding protein [Hamadaea flava]|uniref:MCE family protein n=1 Tax=Hamadaea flava TaxID=1742688 RepID=A0ABV8LHX7_9ACTN|nr:MCE family protein [Hamadaea flava]MCP2325310.1 phospholipid/cholesterol/gamma-HCH transport system substrate-binding protein [Hamadaea flava]
MVAIALALCVSGCQLPGGEPSSGGFAVSAEFTDVLDLVPQAAVKVNDVTVGSVTGVELHGWTAVVRMRVADTVQLPDNTVAAIRQSSLLGEKFVALAAPTDSPQGKLGDGDVIPLERTKRGAEVEEVLAALGLLLNGGGLAQLKTINAEVGKALGGHEADAKSTLHELDKFVAALDAQKDDIVRALDALDRLTKQLAEQTDTIGRAVDALEPGLTVLAGQRAQLTAALVALRDLGSVGKRVIDQSKADTLASLKALQPTLTQLVRAGDALPKGLDLMLSYPFPPNVQKAISGDYVRLHLTLDLDAASILANLVAKGTTPGTPTVPGLPPILPSLPPILPSLPPILPTALPSILPSGLLPSGLLPSGLLPGLPLSAPAVTWEYDPETGEIAGVTGGLQEILSGRST